MKIKPIILLLRILLTYFARDNQRKSRANIYHIRASFSNLVYLKGGHEKVITAIIWCRMLLIISSQFQNESPVRIDKQEDICGYLAVRSANTKALSKQVWTKMYITNAIGVQSRYHILISWCPAL